MDEREHGFDSALTTRFGSVRRFLMEGGASQVDLDAVTAAWSRRRNELAAAAGHDPHLIAEKRLFPVLAVLAPAMTVRGGEVAYPGDPMCLYAALGVSVETAAEAVEAGLTEGGTYNDFVPGWGPAPDSSYRQRAAHGYRGAPMETPDGAVFDPRVWDEESRAALASLLCRVRPRVVMVSAVSTALRQAMAIAAEVRALTPEALIVLGGRHADETIRYDPAADTVRVDPASPLASIRKKRDAESFDFVVAGSGAHALDALLKAIALALPGPDGHAEVPVVLRRLEELAGAGLRVAGTGVIVGVEETATAFLPFASPLRRFQDLPPPYRAFPIRGRFSVFPRRSGESGPCLTAHMMMTDTCPYSCNFCSEGRAVRLPGLRADQRDVPLAIERICEVVHYGAEAAYFDDPVFWGGRFRAMAAFAAGLAELRGRVAESGRCDQPWIAKEEDRERLLAFQWGAQLTVDLIVGGPSRNPELASRTLRAMADGGCTYIYIGIESMAQRVMDGVQKNVHRSLNLSWTEKVREALETVRETGIRVGSSVLFGLEGETEETIEETIEEVGRLLDDELLILASPNLLTYHPGTELARRHLPDGKGYDVPNANRPPYTYFEEAYPGLTSRELDEKAIWTIHEKADRRWGGSRNRSELATVREGASG